MTGDVVMSALTAILLFFGIFIVGFGVWSLYQKLSGGIPMTAPAPHPQRCKTCDFLWKRTCPYYKEIDDETIFGISCDSYIEFTSIVGCASHSSVQSHIPNDEQCRICSKLERDKVLDAIYERLLAIQAGTEPHDRISFKSVYQIIDENRSTGERR